MKLRPGFRPYQLLFAAAVLTLAGRGSVSAQERLHFKDGHTQPVKIVGMAGSSSVQIQVGAGTTAVPLSSVSEVEMAAPPAYAAALAAAEKRDFAGALARLQPLVAKWKGLPTDWARRSTGLLGDWLVELNDLRQAEAAYADFRKFYPGQAPAQTAVGLARIALAKKEYAKARVELDPVADEALGKKDADPANAVAYSQAFALRGQIKESQQDYAGALEDYLRTVAVYPDDKLAVAEAQRRADNLRQVRGVSVP